MKKALVNIALCVIVLALLGLMVAFFVYFDAKAVLLWYSEHLNYYTITLLMTIESSFLPFPSEIVVPPAAYFAHQNPDLDFVLICFFATLGAAIGEVINYVLAILIGRPLLYRFADTKFAHICLIDKDKVAVAEEYFNRHGAISTFIGRLIPSVRQLISIPAGLVKMHFGKFLLYTSLGAGLWNAVLTALGYWLGKFVPESQLYEQVEYYNRYLTWFGYALALAVIVFIAYQIFKPKTRK